DPPGGVRAVGQHDRREPGRPPRGPRTPAPPGPAARRPTAGWSCVTTPVPCYIGRLACRRRSRGRRVDECRRRSRVHSALTWPARLRMEETVKVWLILVP